MSNRNPKVDEWFESYDNPQRELVKRVREIILESNPKIEETIKWQAPTFMYKGNIASFFPKAKQNVTLMFHTGASIADPMNLLEGDGKTSRVARFTSDDINQKAEAIRAIINAWVEAKDS